MKKVLLVILSLVLCVGLLVGCSEKKTEQDMVMDSISYEHKGMYVGSSEDFGVAITNGSKEITMMLDGVKGEMMDYAMITIAPKKVELFAKSFKYTLVGDKGEISGECKRAVIGINHVADIMDLDKIGTIKSVKVSYDDKNLDIELKNCMEGKINARVAVEAVYNASKDDMKSLFVEGKFMAEIHAKYTIDRTSEEPKYYWYVSIMNGNDSSIYALVNPDNAEVVAKKVKMNNNEK